MRVLCSISGVEFNCDHFPGYLHSRETFHPIFNMPQRALIPYARKWSAGELTETDTYLYFLALLNSTDLIDFRVPVIRTQQTQQIIALNLDKLLIAVWNINSVNHPAIVFPRYVITQDTRDLSTVSFWIDNWRSIYNDFQNGCRRDIKDREAARKEAIVERLIKNPHKPIQSYVSQLANWAKVAACFPTFRTVSRFTELPCSCDDYWVDCICRIASNAFAVPLEDLKEIQEHCESNIPIGSIFSNAFFKLLRSAIYAQEELLGTRRSADPRPQYSIIDTPTDLENALIANAILKAPTSEPQRKDYPSNLEFMKAKFRWTQARKQAK